MAKKRFPNNLRDALRMSKDHAKARKNLSVERIADLLGVSADCLYKWLGDGTMPASTIPMYEHVCGASFVSTWLATSAGLMVIPMPRGHKPKQEQFLAFQQLFSDSLSQLAAYWQADKSTRTDSQNDVINSLTQAINCGAWHRENVQKCETPEFDFGD